MSSPIYEMAGIAYRLNVCGLYRDVQEWLLTFPFPPTPIHNFFTYSHSHGIPVWAIPIPSHSHSVNAKVVYN